ncbi:hypothetical protein KFL_000490180 [Klebsormidium nitens]|uniref:Uncharacterized protein n=1 Tax=Klebsormidium nitens TaxID=105231 RepID=A0A0U9HQ98_KLENI|nr:hypothetical protein KFL_000490180 [Klebsormidium nitens]|eukprot:GAQ80228.1 hypothetical protein KFL_000490180 [Klebsormidium nitens]
MVPSMDAPYCPSPSPINSPGGPDELYRHPPAPRTHWPGWTNLAGQQQVLQCARLSELYAALHRHYMLSCPFERLESGTRVLISWKWEPTAEQGVVDVKFKSPAEVAAELADLRRGKVDDNRSNEGGILHLVGSTDVFWSSIIYWHMHGTCMPISYAELGFKVPRPPTKKPPPEDDRFAGPRMRRLNERLSRSSDKSPVSDDESALRPQRNPFPDLPPGWQDARRAWDKALERTARVGYIVHCMFFCSEAGCAAGEHCALRHDEKR